MNEKCCGSLNRQPNGYIDSILCAFFQRLCTSMCHCPLLDVCTVERMESIWTKKRAKERERMRENEKNHSIYSIIKIVASHFIAYFLWMSIFCVCQSLVIFRFRISSVFVTVFCCCFILPRILFIVRDKREQNVFHFGPKIFSYEK